MSLPTLVGTPDPEPQPQPRLSVAVQTASSVRPAYVDVVLGGIAGLSTRHPIAVTHKAPQHQGFGGYTKPIDALLRAVEDIHTEQHDRFSVDMCQHALCRAASEVPTEGPYPWDD